MLIRAATVAVEVYLLLNSATGKDLCSDHLGNVGTVSLFNMSVQFVDLVPFFLPPGQLAVAPRLIKICGGCSSLKKGPHEDLTNAVLVGSSEQVVDS